MKSKSILAVLCLQTSLAFGQPGDDQLYKEALAQARAGQLEPALQQFQMLVDKHPDKKRYRFDYLQTLSWADRNAEVMQQAEKIDIATAPVYVLEAIAKAARNLGEYKQAETLYRRVLAKASNRLPAKLGIGLLLIDQGQTKPALDYLQNLNNEYPENIDITLALATAFQLEGQFQQAGEFYQKASVLQPDRQEAWRGLILSQAAVGDIRRAVETAKAHKAVLTDEQWVSLNWDYATSLVREGEQALAKNSDEYAGIDRAIEVLNANIESLNHLKLKDPQPWFTRAQADRLRALSDRKRMADVIEKYEKMPPQVSALPVYARTAVADAYLNGRQPEKARDLYLSIIRDQPNDFHAHASLVRTYLETGQQPEMQQALRQLQTLMESLPDNNRNLYDYLQLLSWAGWNDEVMKQAAKIDTAAAPAYILEAIAKAARNLRDYQKAEALYRLAIGKAPERLEPKLGLGLVLIDKRQAKPAISYFNELALAHPDDPNIMLAQAHAYELDGQFQRAGEFYQKATALQPEGKDNLLGLINTLATSGRFGQALTLAKTNRALLADEQWAGLNWDYATSLIRQGQQALGKNPDDYAALDQAITSLNANIESVKRLKLKEPQVWLTRAQSDLLVALHDRKRMADVIEQYQQLQEQGRPLPRYARMAVADAYLNNAQAEAARDVYLDLIQENPDDFDAHAALARIYLETGQKQPLQQALLRIQRLVEKYPEKKQYRYDYLQLLFWADRNDEVMRQAALIDEQAAPVYVLEAIAKAARNLGDYPKAEASYRLASDKAPERLAPKLGLGLLLLDQRQAKPAIAYLHGLARDYPENIDIAMAQAQAHELDGQYQPAGEFYRKALAIQPDRPEAWRGLAFALTASGEVRQALDIAEAHRTLFSDEQWAGLKWNHAGWLIRQGEQALGQNSRDYRAIDLAIAELHANIEAIPQLKLDAPEVWRMRAESDLLVALRDRKRMAEVIVRYQQLQDQGMALPVYARMAAADAYLNNRQPQVARDLYLAVSREVPDYFNAKASLVYAYLEAEQPDKAVALAEQLAREQPEKIEFKQTDGTVVTGDNPRKIAADLTAAVFRAYVDDLDTAQARLEELHNRHPENTDIHSKLAEVYYFRGWPRKARQQIAEARLQAPEHFGLKLGQAKVAHELRDYPQEERITRELYDSYPEDSGTLRQMNAWRKHNAPELKLFANGGISNSAANGVNPVIGSDNVSIDGYLYSSPIAYNYRVFTHEGWKTGLFNEGRGFLRHYGAGLEYAKRNLMATAELHYDNFRIDTVGVDLGLDYQLNDHWQLFSRLSSRDDNISLRALNTGVTAKTARLGTTYRVNESRQFTVAGAYYHFSDADKCFSEGGSCYVNEANNRYTLDGTYYERWYSGPSYKFSTYLNAGVSNNSSSNVFYFSPRNDASLSLTLDNDWLTYRNYETAFHQRLALSVGNYWQEYLSRNSLGNLQYVNGSNIVGNLQYEHRWQFGNSVELTYGGVRGYRNYGGDPTESWQLYLTADVRF